MMADVAEAGDNWIEDFVPYRLYRVTNRLNAKLLSRLKSIRINPSQWRVLSVLKAYGVLNIGQIADLTLMEQPTVSRVVAQLEGKGGVSRRPSAADARVTEVALTPKGVEAFEHIIPTALRHQQLAFEGFSAKELETLKKLLSKIEQNIESYD
jgi:DNA-binding MarR family transcriptional regulator